MAGLNITACNHVIIMDPWWNPYVEEQAIARAYRMGQTKEVHVYHIVCPRTIEDRINVVCTGLMTRQTNQLNSISFLLPDTSEETSRD